MENGKKWDGDFFVGYNPPKDQDKEWGCADNQGNLYLTWTQFDEYESRQPGDSTNILFATSTDQGKSWSDPLAINQFKGNCLDGDSTVEGAMPVIGPDGEIYVTWAFANKIYFDKSTDGGKTWLENDIVVAEQEAGWSFDVPAISRANGFPVIACDTSSGPGRGTIYLSWTDKKDGHTDVWFTKSEDGGNQWIDPVRVNNDSTRAEQFFVWMTFDQSDQSLYFVFYDRRAYDENGIATDVYLAYSFDPGHSFKNVKISESPFIPNEQVFFGDYTNIVAYKGIVRPVWTRMDQGKLSIWTALINKKDLP